MLTRALFALVLVLVAVTTSPAEEAKVVALGVTDHVATQEELKGGAAPARPRFNTPGIAYALVANGKKGDVVVITLNKDGKPLMSNTQELDQDEALVLLQAGKTGVPAGGWPEGRYSAAVKVTRGGTPLIDETSEPIPFE